LRLVYTPPYTITHEANATALHRVRNIMLAVIFGLISAAVLAQTAPAPLRFSRSVILPNISGKFDHFAFDPAAKRLFVAATGSHSVEVVDLSTGSVIQSIPGLSKPHGLAWVPETSSLYVADGALAELRVYKGSPLALAGTIKLSNDADDMVYNSTLHRLYVGHGGSDPANPARIAVVDTTHFALIANVSVASHPEALDLDEGGQRVFANIAGSNEVAVIDASTDAIAAHWKLTKAADNVPMAYDSEHNLLFVACRKPGMLIAIDASTGNELASAQADAGADDLFYDAVLKRVYVIAGSGVVDVYQVDAQKQLHPLEATHTASGAKTGLFVPSQHALYVGIPADSAHPAEVRIYVTSTAQGNQ
jgi:YVTN family beta-propeller protein